MLYYVYVNIESILFQQHNSVK